QSNEPLARWLEYLAHIFDIAGTAEDDAIIGGPTASPTNELVLWPIPEQFRPRREPEVANSGRIELLAYLSEGDTKQARYQYGQSAKDRRVRSFTDGLHDWASVACRLTNHDLRTVRSRPEKKDVCGKFNGGSLCNKYRRGSDRQRFDLAR